MVRYSILSCKVFENEIAKFPSRNPPRQIEFFDISLHLRPDLMRERILSKLEKFSDDNEYILFMFGLCGNAADGIRSDKFKLVIPRMHECVAMFLNASERYDSFKKNEISTYFASPGWVSNGLFPGKESEQLAYDKYSKKFPNDTPLVDDLMESFKELYKPYNKCLYVDFIGDSDSEKYCRDCAKYLQWDFEKIERPESEFFRDAIDQRWDDEKRFLTIPAGKTICRVYDERIIDAK